MSRILNDFLKKNKDQSIRVIFANGFQLSGCLKDFDENYMIIDTYEYNSSTTVHGSLLVTVDISAITTFVPAKK